MSSEVTGEQLPRLIKHTNHVVAADHLVEVHRHLVVIHLISHDEITMLQQKGDAEEHQKGIAVAELARRRQRTLAQLILARTRRYEIDQLRRFLALLLSGLLLRRALRHGRVVLMPTLGSLTVRGRFGPEEYTNVRGALIRIVSSSAIDVEFFGNSDVRVSFKYVYTCRLVRIMSYAAIIEAIFIRMQM